MRRHTAFPILAVAIGCGGSQSTEGNVAPWMPPIPSCSCPTAPTASAAPPPSTAPSASAAPDAGGPPLSTEKRLLQGVVTGVAGRVVPNAVVYLEDAPKEPGRGETALIDQHSMTFFPMVTVITSGGTVTFNNSDPFPHNVYTRDNGERFDSGMVSSHVQRKHQFKNPGVYKLLCNLHPNMLAFIVVSPSSYFAVTNGQGKFSIKDVPEGTYKVTTWASGLAQDSQSVKVAGGEVTFNPSLHK